MPRPLRPAREAGRTVVLLAFLSACTIGEPRQPATEESASSSRAADPTRTFVYECTDGFGFVARIAGEQAWVFTPGQSVALRRVPAASGARYSNGQTVFWSKGPEALLETGEHAHRDCRNDRRNPVWEDARQRGVDFRAVGNEPGWFLEITRSEDLLFVADYGAERYVFPTPEPRIEQRATETVFEARTDRHRLDVTLADRPCFDVMSGAPFETTVTVRLDDRLYRGCGRSLR